MTSASELRCPVCEQVLAAGGYLALGEHFVALAERSDGQHIMWLNRRVTKHRTDAPALAGLLKMFLEEGRSPSTTQRVER